MGESKHVSNDRAILLCLQTDMNLVLGYGAITADFECADIPRSKVPLIAAREPTMATERIPHGITETVLLHILQVSLLELSRALLLLLGRLLVLRLRVAFHSPDLLLERKEKRRHRGSLAN